MVHTFEGWKFHAGAGGKESDDDCCCPESETTFGGDCVSCIDGTTPLKWAVTFNNVGNQDCLECTDFNATFILEQRAGVLCPRPFIAADCCWGFSSDNLPCSNEPTNPTCEITLFMAYNPTLDAITFQLEVVTRLESGTCIDLISIHHLQAGLGNNPIDCNKVYVLPYLPGQFLPSDPTQCDFVTASTATLTPVADPA